MALWFIFSVLEDFESQYLQQLADQSHHLCPEASLDTLQRNIHQLREKHVPVQAILNTVMDAINKVTTIVKVVNNNDNNCKSC